MFSKGQKLVCVEKRVWAYGFGPAHGEVVTFDCVAHWDNAYIRLAEYLLFNGKENAYISTSFRPLVGSPAKAELLEKFVEVVESPDCPIKTPHHV